MRLCPLYIIGVILLLMGCSKGAPQRDEAADALREEGFQALNHSDAPKALRIGVRLCSIPEDPKKPYYRIYGKILQGQAYFLMDSVSRVYPLLQEAEQMALATANDSALCSVYNGLSIYAANVENDLKTSMEYSSKGLEAAKRIHYDRLYLLILSNIANRYAMAEDPSGLTYALDCVDYGTQAQDKAMLYIGAVSAASCYLADNQLDKALEYARKAEEANRETDMHDSSTLNYVYGAIYQKQGHPAKAEEHLRKAVSVSKTEKCDLRAYISLAGLLNARGDCQESLELLLGALKQMENANIKTLKPQMLHAIADTYTAMGNQPKAIEYQELAAETEQEQKLAGSLLTIERIRHDYDLSKSTHAIMHHQTLATERKRQVTWLLWILALVVISAVLIFWFQRKKNLLQRALVASLTEGMRREETLREQLSTQLIPMPKPVAPSPAPLMTEEAPEQARAKAQAEVTTPPHSDSTEAQAEAPALPEDKAEEIEDSPVLAALLPRFVALMENPEVYRDNLLTKDKVAKKLGTNRTYISALVNKEYGMSFTAYVNHLRIQGAIKTLSDPTNTEPLKAIGEALGYNSMTTFYAKFKAVTGMTPTTFRNQSRKSHST